MVVLAGVGVVRITSTYGVFSQTIDEPAHLAAGMEWLQRGTYTFDPIHPPLGRVAVALGPYLSGLRLTGQTGSWEEGNEILLAHDRYSHNLSLARFGVLPFFLVTTLLVWQWGRRRYGDGPALVATMLFTTSPVVLAHAGLATTDMAGTAAITAALMAYLHLLERPSYPRSATFGVAAGLALLSKLSALVFLPACGLALLVWRWFLGREEKGIVVRHRFRWPTGLALAALAMWFIIWGGYRFSVSAVADADTRPYRTLDQLLGPSGTLHDWAYSAAESPWVPAPAFFRGVAALRGKQTLGQKSYLLGHVRQTGWWYFFLVTLAVKTTLPFLVLAGLGVFYLGRSAWIERNWIAATPVVAALALLLVCMPSQINSGARHILSIYPLLAIIGGVATRRLWNSAKPKYAGRAVVLALLAWHFAASIRTHPDYLAYFNELAGQHPERILVDSDLDWGQDLFRLSAVLQQKRVAEVSIAYTDSKALDLRHFGLPPFRVLSPFQPTVGWIAIGLRQLKTGGSDLPTDSFSWLEAHEPVGLVGRSIRLYYVPDSVHGEPQREISESEARNSQ